ncbi:MAG: diguanylate cyclase [Eubacteriaceae bacterium]
MNNTFSMKVNIPKLIIAINESDNIEEISRLENILLCIYASPILLLASLSNFIMRYFLWNEAIWEICFDSCIFLLLAIIFEIISRVKLSTTIATIFISILYSTWFVFVSLRFYERIGPAIWTLAILHMVLAIAHINRIVLNVISITTLFVIMYFWIFSSDKFYVLNSVYYSSQITLFIIIFIVSAGIHKINSIRYKRVINQLKREIVKKEEITDLYQEISQSQEELREQNELLLKYNVKIKRNEKKLNYLAYHDSLTGLANRKMIIERLEKNVKLCRKNSTLFSIAFIDIDNFKNINDTMGHHVGDEFIKEVSKRLRRYVHNDDIIGRLGGDEFALIIQSKRRLNTFLYIERIRESISQPFQIQNTSIFTSASFGIAIYPKDGENSNELLKNADIAMYKAKKMGKNNIQFFNN